jgi:methyl-accepting chemotaxis protein
MRFDLAKRLGLILFAGFGAIFILTAVTISLTISKTESVKNHTQEVLENEIPYVIHLMDLESQVYKSVNALNVYLISGDIGDRLDFRQEMIKLKEMINSQSQLVEADYKTTSLMKVIYHKYNAKAKEIIEIKADYQLNFIGIVKAAELLNPLHLQFSGALNSLIDTQIEETVESDRREILDRLINMKNSWSNMILTLRSYFTTKSDFDRDNLNIAREETQRAMINLLQIREQLEFDAVFVDELGQTYRIYMENLPEVIGVYQTDKWRMDFYLTRNEIYPIIDSLRQLVRSLVENRQTQTAGHSDTLNSELDQLGDRSRQILIAALLIGLFVLFLVIRSVKALLSQLEIQRNS